MPTTHTCYAAIDIGSNAVRLLIKKVKEDETVLNKRLSKVLCHYGLVSMCFL